MPTVNDPDGEPQRVIKGHAETNSTIITELEHASQESLDAYSWSSGTFNPGTDDTILLVQNKSSDDLQITTVWLSTDVDTRVIIHSPTAVFTIASATSITGVNLNKRGSNLLSTDKTTADARQNETGNVRGDILWAGEIMAAGNPFSVSLEGAVILAKGDSIGVDYVADVAACDVTIMGHFGD